MSKGKNGGGKGSGLEQKVQKAVQAILAITQDLEDEELESLTPDERLHSAGKLRDREDEAMTAILDTIDAHPGVFASLAAHDHGKDDKVVETDPARAALARRGLLAPLAKALDVLLTRVSDDMMANGALAKDVTVPGYAIIKANAPMLPALRKSAAPAVAFYQQTAKKKGPKAASKKASKKAPAVADG